MGSYRVFRKWIVGNQFVYLDVIEKLIKIGKVVLSQIIIAVKMKIILKTVNERLIPKWMTSV